MVLTRREDDEGICMEGKVRIGNGGGGTCGLSLLPDHKHHQ